MPDKNLIQEEFKELSQRKVARSNKNSLHVTPKNRFTKSAKSKTPMSSNLSD